MISLIVAMGKNRAIGKDNQLLWHLPGDLPRFKKITSGHSIIMGRKTYESIGRPLPGRQNIVISRNEKLRIDGCLVVSSLSDALKKSTSEEKFIIGGGEIFRESLPLADKIYLTLVEDEPEADTFFPEFSYEEYVVNEKTEVNHQPKFHYIDLVKKN